MRANTATRGWTGATYTSVQNAATVISGQLESGESPLGTILYWLDRRATLAELRYSGIPAMVDYAMEFESAITQLTLSDQQRQVFHARYQRNLSTGETGGLLGLSRQAVNTYCRRIAVKLLKILGRMGGDINK
jgi:hypothetical protein